MDVIVYAICLGAGLLFTIIGAALGHLFGGGDADADVGTGGHADAGFEHTGMPGVSPFSPTMIAAFVTSFGAFGLILSKIEVTSSPWVSAPLSVLGGLLITGVVFWLLHTVFSKTQSSSESKVGLLVGQSATIITPIPENGVGEIAYVQSGSRYTAPARSENGEAIPGGKPVVITRTGTQFYVQRTD